MSEWDEAEAEFIRPQAKWSWVRLDDAARERLADEFMDLRLDGPWIGHDAYQEVARRYADRFIAALREAKP